MQAGDFEDQVKTHEYVENSDQAGECKASAGLCVTVVDPLICIQK